MRCRAGRHECRQARVQAGRYCPRAQRGVPAMCRPESGACSARGSSPHLKCGDSATAARLCREAQASSLSSTTTCTQVQGRPVGGNSCARCRATVPLGTAVTRIAHPVAVALDQPRGHVAADEAGAAGQLQMRDMVGPAGRGGGERRRRWRSSSCTQASAFTRIAPRGLYSTCSSTPLASPSSMGAGACRKCS